MTTPKCGHCGNDGRDHSLFLTIDAKWDYDNKRWILEPREDDGGCEIDCLACDERTTDDPSTSAFPYGPLPAAALEAWRALQCQPGQLGEAN
jgi:hypothetical protein